MILFLVSLMNLSLRSFSLYVKWENEFEMIMMGELRFFQGLQIK